MTMTGPDTKHMRLVAHSLRQDDPEKTGVANLLDKAAGEIDLLGNPVKAMRLLELVSMYVTEAQTDIHLGLPDQAQDGLDTANIFINYLRKELQGRGE